MSRAFYGLALVVWFLTGIVGLIITFGIVQKLLGTVVAVIGIFLFPFVLAFAPWYAGIADSNWQPLIVIYGGTAVAAVLFFLGNLVER